MKLFKIITAALLLASLAACAQDYGQADHRPAYLANTLNYPQHP